MSNTLFVAGQSGNKKGRPKGTKYSSLTLRGKLERFLNKNMTARSMQTMYDSLTPGDKSKFLATILNYTLPKQTTDGLSSEEVDKLYQQLKDLQQSMSNERKEAI